jgi:uncharacterized RDD family membrane protein YckC
MQAQWWYANSDQKLGPVTFEALQQKLYAQEILETTLVWREGFVGWLPVSEVDEFKQPLKVMPPALPVRASAEIKAAPNRDALMRFVKQAAVRAPAEIKAVSNLPATPWKRIVAKLFDFLSLSLLVSPLFVFITLYCANQGYPFGVWLLEPGAELVLGVVLVPLILFFEACVFTLFGNTMGKALLGIQVTDTEQKQPTFVQYLLRQWGVYWLALGAGLPLISLGTMLFQLIRLRKRGSTGYDENRFIVTEKEIGLSRLVFVTLVTIILLFGSFVISSISKPLIARATAQAVATEPVISTATPEKQATLPSPPTSVIGKASETLSGSSAQGQQIAKITQTVNSPATEPQIVTTKPAQTTIASSTPEVISFNPDTLSEAGKQSFAIFSNDREFKKGVAFVADKPNARLYVFKDGKYQGETAALFGRAKGDVQTELGASTGKPNLKSFLESDKVTPAGKYSATTMDMARYGRLVYFNNDDGLAIHVIKSSGDTWQLRLETPTPLDNKITFGTINTTEEFYNKHLATLPLNVQATVYIVPEVYSPSVVFALGGKAGAHSKGGASFTSAFAPR